MLAVKDLWGLVEDFDGLIDEAVPPVFFDNEAKGVWGNAQIVMGVHLIKDFPHGFVFLRAGECTDELFALNGCWVVRRVVCLSPVEEAEGFSGRGGAGPEDSVDELGVDGDSHFIEGALHVDVAADDVGDVVDGGEVVVLGRFAAIDSGGGEVAKE